MQHNNFITNFICESQVCACSTLNTKTTYRCENRKEHPAKTYAIVKTGVHICTLLCLQHFSGNKIWWWCSHLFRPLRQWQYFLDSMSVPPQHACNKQWHEESDNMLLWHNIYIIFASPHTNWSHRMLEFIISLIAHCHVGLCFIHIYIN
jgi:hypothetical protein